MGFYESAILDFFFHIRTSVHYCHIALLAQIPRILMSNQIADIRQSLYLEIIKTRN